MKRAEYEKTFRAEKSFWWFVAKTELTVRLAAEGLPGPGGGILDLGCGAGANLEALAGLGEAFGLDREAAALEFSSARGLSGLVAGLAERLPFPDGRFALVTALDLLEHLDDDRAALAEASRVLRLGGRLLLTVPAYPWLWGSHDEALGHRRRYGRRELRERLQAAGFRPLREFHFFGLVFPLLLAVRLGQKRWGNPEETVSYEPWPPLNRWLLKLARVEAGWARRSGLPWGSTLVVLAEKPGP